MNENIKNLKKEFIKISELGWIKKESNCLGEVGNNFEKLLSINSNNFEIPDYNGIELKTKSKFSSILYIKLFNATPDGKYLFEIKRIREKYGYPDKEMKSCKVFNKSIYSDKIYKSESSYFFKLKVNRKDKRIYLNVFDKNMFLIDNDTSWSFGMLEEKLLRKLQILAIVDVINKKIDGNYYYKYNSINLYKLKNFDSFIKLIEKGAIRITFKIGVFKKGKRLGEIYDHGTGFEIKKNDIEYLYDKLE